MAQKKTKLHIVGDNSRSSAIAPVRPPRKLGKSGQSLWDSVQAEYAVEDIGGIELLAQCCEALDRVESCRAQINADGELIKCKSGVREHPLIRAELQNRAFIARCIQRLGLDVEALRSGPGRPGHGIGVMGDGWS